MQDINFILEDDEYVPEPKVKQSFWKRVKNKIWKLFCFLLASIFVSVIKRTLDKAEQKRRYKKVIKKGIFWDTEYLIERDDN